MWTADLETDTVVVEWSGFKDMKNQKGKKTKSPVGFLKSNMNIKPDLRGGGRRRD